ncbi:MAG: hypothetical protein KDA46_14155 [Parvularculaceae bacterium]|nr:hypothetical protein [Parvularculaceae bacterium]
MQRILIGLIAVQTMAIFFFGFRVMEIDARTQELALAPRAAMPNQTITSDQPRPETPPADNRLANAAFLSPDEIRKIIREELQYAQASAVRQAPQKPAETITSAEISSIKSAASYDLGRFISNGRIDETEMASFQAEIAKLPPEQRREMLSKLTKAINAGQIDAQF